MSRYMQGTLEKCIKDIIADALEAGMGEQDRSSDVSEEASADATHERGRVVHPSTDRRLKENRDKAA